MTDRIYQDLMNGLKTNNNVKQWVKDNVNNKWSVRKSYLHLFILFILNKINKCK